MKAGESGQTISAEQTEHGGDYGAITARPGYQKAGVDQKVTRLHRHLSDCPRANQEVNCLAGIVTLRKKNMVGKKNGLGAEICPI